MPIHTLETIPQEPEETFLECLSNCPENWQIAAESAESRLALLFTLLSLTFCLVLGPAGILAAAVIIILCRYLSVEQGSHDASEEPPEEQTPAPTVDAATRRRRAAEAAERRAITANAGYERLSV